MESRTFSSRFDIASLSEREQQVLTLSTKGYTDKEIARDLGLGLATVHTYWIRIKNKLGGVTRAEIVAEAVQRSTDQTLMDAEAERRALMEEIRRRAQAQEELMQSSQLLQSIIDATPDVVFLKTLDGRYELVNNSFTSITGFSLDDIIGKSDHELFGEQGRQYETTDEAVKRRLEPVENVDVVPVNGVTRFWSTVKFPVFDDSGELQFVGGITRDVTRERALVRDLRQSREQLSLAFDAANLIHWAWDLETGDVNWSEHTEQLHGLPPGTFKGTFEAWQKLVHEDDLPLVLNALERSLESCKPYQIEFRTKRPDGAQQWLLTKGEAIVGDDGKAKGMVGIAIDVTEIKRNEANARNSEAVQRLVLEVAGINEWEYDLDTEVVILGEGSPKRLGLNRHTVSLDEVVEMIHPDDRELVRDTHHRAKSTGRLEIHYRIRMPDGSYRARYAKGQVVPDPKGKMTRVVGITMDDPSR